MTVFADAFFFTVCSAYSQVSDIASAAGGEWVVDGLTVELPFGDCHVFLTGKCSGHEGGDCWASGG